MSIKVKMLADVIIRGKPAYQGEIVEVDSVDCNILLSYKQAEVYIEPIKKKEEKNGKNNRLT